MHEPIDRPIRELRQVLNGIWWQTFGDLLLRAFLALLVFGLLGVVGLYAADRLGVHPAFGLAVGGALGAIFGVMVLDWRMPLRCASQTALVLEVERHHQLPRGELLSPLQIAQYHAVHSGMASPALVQGAIDDAARLALRLPRRSLLGGSRWPIAGLLATGALVSAICLIDSDGLFGGLTRLLDPIEVQAPFRVWVDRHVAARGDSVMVYVRSLAPLAEPLYLSSTEEEGPDARWESEPVTEAAPARAGTPGLPLHRARMGPLLASRHFFVSSGPSASEILEVRVEDRPRLVRFHTTTEFPEYLGQAPVEEERTDGNLSVPWGSHVQLSVESDQPLSSARLLMGPRRLARELRLAADRKAGTVEFGVEDPTDYEIEVTGLSGLTNLPVRYHIKPLEDRSPIVRILKPGRDLTLGSEQTVTIELSAEDDHRVDRVELLYSVDSGPEQVRPVEIVPGEKIRVEQIWDLRALGLSFEQELSYYVAAWDNDTLRGPKRGVSPTYKLRMPSFYEIYEEAEQQQNQEIKSVSGLAEKQKQLLEELDRMASSLSPDEDLDWKQTEELRGAEKKQQEIKEQAEAIAKQLHEKVEELRKDSLATDEVLQKMEEVSKLFQKLADEDMQKILEQIQKALEGLQLSQDQLEELQKNMSAERLVQGLDRTLELLHRLEAERQLEALSELAEKLAEKQENLADSTRKLLDPKEPNSPGRTEAGSKDPNDPGSAKPDAADDSAQNNPSKKDDLSRRQDPSPTANPSGRPESDSPQDSGEDNKPADGKQSADATDVSGAKPPRTPEELAREQRDLAPELDSMQKKLDQLSESDALESISEDLGKLNEELGDPSSDAEEAGQALERKQLDSAQRIQGPLGKRLKGLSQRLRQMAEQMRGMQLRELLAIIEELVEELSAVTVRLDDLRDRALALSDLSRFSILSNADRSNISSVATELELGRQASRVILERIVELGGKSPELSKEVADKVETAKEQLEEAQDGIEMMALQPAAERFRLARVQLHEASVALLSLTEALSEGVPSAGQSLRQGLEDLAEEQRRLSESMRQGKGSGGIIPMPIPRSMEQMASEQARIRRELQQLQQEFEALQGSMGSLEGLEDDMKDLERDYKDGALRPEVEEKQKKVLDKLLEAQKSLRERKLDPQRESQTAKPMAPAPPSPSRPVEEPWELQLHGLMEDHEADLSPEDRQVLERYYLRLAEEEP